MSFFGLFKSYTKDDLDREIAKMRNLYIQAMGNHSPQVKHDLALQLHKVLEICRKGGFYGGEMVEWPTAGCYTTLRDVTPVVQIMIDLM